MRRLFFFIFFVPSLLLAQHKITGVFSPGKDYNIALLYKVGPTISDYVANATIDEDGRFEFKLDSAATKGVYRLVYAVPQEDYNFDIIYNGKEDVELVFMSETGVTFKSSGENKLLKTYRDSMSVVTQSIGRYFSQNKKDTLALKAIFKTQKETQIHFEAAAEGTIVFDFIRANKPYVPDHVKPVSTYIENLEKHYFDYIDFKSSTLQSSNFLEEKIVNYVFGIHLHSKDELENYKKNIDIAYSHIKEAPEKVQRILLFDLWQQMSDLGHESIANYIAEHYLINIATSLKDKQLVEVLMLYKSLSKGAIAPSFDIEIKEKNTLVVKELMDLKAAKNYIIVFWSSGCSHCLKEVPKLQSFINTLEEGEVKVIAVGLEKEPYDWKNLTYNYPEFIHVYGEGKWDNKIGNAYGVKATPTYFILDEDKKIAAKPVSFEALKKFFQKKN